MDAPDPPATPTPTPYTRPLDPAPAVRWLSPTELGRTGLKVLLGSLFGQYVDKREIQQGPSFDQGVCFDHTGEVSAGEPYWLDYVSDIGDGFDATYSVASLLAGDLTDLDGSDRDLLKRGSILVMGGDEVYPTGDVRNYERRTTDVYAAALPASDPRPVAYAVPGNHDWYDGLTSFLRVFGQTQRMGGWDTQQLRSYFALRLPHRWWLFGLDIQLDTYIDRPQLEYFREVGEQMADGDRLILCTAKPAWYHFDPEKHAGMDQLTHFLKYALAGRDVRIPLILTGDVHHYARYSTHLDGDRPQTLITSGHGGAYLAATDPMDEELAVPLRLADPKASRHDTRSYRLRSRWPSPERSRSLARGVWRLPFRNPGLPWLLALLQAGIISAAMKDLLAVLVGLVALVVVACLAFARPRRIESWAVRVWGVSLAVPQLAVSFGVAEICDALTDGWSDGAVVAAVAVASVIAGYLSAEVLALWLLVVGRFGVNVNELFAAQSIEDYKGFLRLRIDPDGSLTVYPIGIERRVRHWLPAGDGEGPRRIPAQGERLDPKLIEPPVHLS
ncbi:MAG TPA: metallophosphoesterase [Nocardioidaceae bacterium]|nr:metallophosphoesterase [Nocardioidaceae bacterium]